MAELTFRSAGVSVREIDLSGPTQAVPTGVPAGVIGTANRGPAFVPVTVATTQDFYAKFGATDGEKFGPLAVTEWLRNAGSATYVRVLGVGRGEKRTSTGDNLGRVQDAGFIVGQQLPTETGMLANNKHANVAPGGSGGNTMGALGRTHFLGCFMSESIGSTLFQDAGWTEGYPVPQAYPVVRGIIFAASGVVPMLSGSTTAQNTPLASTVANHSGPFGFNTGSVDLGSDGKSLFNFVMLLNGHKGADSEYPRILTASLDPGASNYFGKIFNKDLLKVQDAGYVLYNQYDVTTADAVVTGQGILNTTHWYDRDGTNRLEDVAFMLTGALGRNAGSSIVPNYENFEDRFKTAFSPSIISQKFGSDGKNLFKVHALDDGNIPNLDSGVKVANNRFKISIQNIVKSTSTTNLFGTFDLVVRDFYDTDDDPVILEEFRGLNLDRTSDNFVARRVGDQRAYYDFEKSTSEQKLAVEGSFPNVSNYIRIELSSLMKNKQVDDTALPVGFRGISHMVTSGSILDVGVGVTSSLLAPAIAGAGRDDVADSIGNHVYARSWWPSEVREPPLPLRRNLKIGTGNTARSNNSLHWGVQFTKVVDVDETNKSRLPDPSVASFTRYLPNFQSTNMNFVVGEEKKGTAISRGTITDPDVFNNNKFTLENVQVKTGSNGKVDLTTVKDWTYVRDGNITANEANKTRALSVSTDFGVVSLKPLNKFSFFVQGGFNGVNVLNEATSELTNRAVKEEMGDTNRGQDAGPTVRSYRRALDVMGSTTNVDIQVLAIPGLRHAVVTDAAIDTVETRFDALYVMDVEERDTLNTVITSSLQDAHVGNTVTSFRNRALDSSFAAAYFPDVNITDPTKGTLVTAPPSVAVLGALSLNDALGHPWFAPAGFTRGTLRTVQSVAVNLSRNNLDDIYDADINPITTFPGSGPVVWGQKTLQQAQTSLDRINVRRLLVEIRRQVRTVANQMLFEPNREETLKRFSNLVNPIMKRIQDQRGVERFRVVIDTTTTTQVDVENNTVRGKIFVQPTRTAEFVSLDFVVTNTIAN